MAGSDTKFSDLGVRIASSAVIAGGALFCIWAGGFFVLTLAVAAGVLMLYEASTITAKDRQGAAPVLLLGMTMLLGAIAVAALPVWQSVLWIVLALGLVVALEEVLPKGLGWRHGIVDAAIGGYITAAVIAFVLLRGVEPYGFLSILWAALVVVAADVGGYFAGRIIGGPKLWPAVSPKKTWAGLGGGVVLAFLVGGLFSWGTTGTYFYQVCVVSMIAAVVSQGGDLAESALKRHYGVKDASSLIPGHGGVLDRLDGHMAAILVAAVVTFSRGQPVFIW